MLNVKRFKEVVEKLRRAGRKAAEKGLTEIAGVGEDLVEEAEVYSWSDYKELLDKDVPDTLRELLKRAGYERCTIYHLKDKVALPEYIAICGNTVFEFDVDVECWEGEEEEKGFCKATLQTIIATRRENFSEAILPSYHEVWH